MAREHLFVFCYDVASAKARRRMAELLESTGTRVQQSVFEVRTTAARAQALLRRLGQERHVGDSVRMYCLTEEGRARSAASGGAPIPERSEFWLL
ncbi:CRISPR-associated endonuclease Cas2 [Rhodoplanes serenus]|uniref:CRISPR-associated endoribonuclease Cas2 n=1 Tax=Rhodoplanes serenus TaxID=200615 RepID=A0A3S4AZW5_9BRAD|nr:CRISPR-associated endonuclease Cas2 [Rhodoplanes serenus]MBI5113543.1 CRISPR-associated endonuclease Cas2 [Rhodovulum sp.]MTW19047.1 CRISPR-associated endonuclease Cas2 [Rhodoplanes serenus]VCU08234.1 CRISPR-associated endoribonuclease Cas2 3 [Rhodoplanes serenus]